MKKYSKSELEHLINEWVIGRNATRNKKIIKDKLIHGMTILQVANKYKLSETRTKTVIRTFRKHIESLEAN